MARLRAVLLAVFLLPLSSSSSPPSASSVLPYSLLRLVEFKANDEIVERDLTLSATPDDGHNSTQSCLDLVPESVGGRFLCSVRSLFESQFEPRSGLIGESTFAALHRDLLDYPAHPCNHGNPVLSAHPSPGSLPGPSSEVIIALQGGFLLYGCHNYISLALQKPRNALLTNFVMLKAFKVPHNLIQFKECAEPPEEQPPCTLTAAVWKQNNTLIAEDYVCCCNGTGCAAVIVDQGGLISPFPLLRFNVELDGSLTADIEKMIYPHGGGKFRIGGNFTVRRRRYFTNGEFDLTEIVLLCMIFLTIACSMALLLCFQWFCKDTIVNDA